MRVRAATAIAAIAAAALPASAAATTNPLVETTGPLVAAHGHPIAAPLPGGDALVAAGYAYRGSSAPIGPGLPGVPDRGWTSQQAEVYDSATGSFTLLADETIDPRRDGVAAPLGDGRVLITGGGYAEAPPFASAEIYDPSSQEFTLTGSMADARRNPFAVSLPDGRVLVGGGRHWVPGEGGPGHIAPLASTEIYDPATGEFTAGPSMLTPRVVPVAAPLPDGRVIVLGGDFGQSPFRTEIFDLGAEAFEPGPAAPFWTVSSATALGNGRILIVTSPTIQEYDPEAESFIDTGIEAGPYGSSAAAPLPGNRALFAGRETSSSAAAQKQAWIYVTAPLAAGEAIDFGEVPVAATSGPEALTISNEGAQDLEVQAASLAGPAAARFAIVADECSGETLALGEECAIEVTVTPAAVGPLTASVQLTSNAPSSPDAFALSAVATAGVERKSPSGRGGQAGDPAAAPVTGGPAKKKVRKVCRKGRKAGKRKGKGAAQASRVRCVRQGKGVRPAAR